MNLWIRSQDKKMLLKVETIEVVNNWFYLNDKHDIGFYKTKERALEVLDDIENILKGKIENHINKFDVYNGDDIKIYEMPQE